MSTSKGPRKSTKKKRPLSIAKKEPEDTGGDTPIVMVHKHCLNCGISISPDSETCSVKCQEEWDRMLKRKKFWNYLPFLGAAFLLVLYIIFSMA
jgi:predicted nucleic acid-binding Zn ribbon protein